MGLEFRPSLGFVAGLGFDVLGMWVSLWVEFLMRLALGTRRVQHSLWNDLSDLTMQLVSARSPVNKTHS